MRLTVFASGSGGNCLLLSGGGTNILIDAGLSTRRLSAMLGERCLSLQDIGGVLITHEHSDHISGLKTLYRRCSGPVYAPRTVAARLRGMLPELDEHLVVIPVGESFSVGRLSVRAFRTPHDTDESVGYRVEDGASFAIATDMGCVTEEVRQNLLGCDAVLIESNDSCAALARELAENGTETIILGHLSRQNNTPEKAMRAASAALAGTGARLLCAPVFGCLEVAVEEKKCSV